MESAARIASVAGVPALTNNLGNQVSNLVVAHNSLANYSAPAFGDDPGQFGLWLTPFYGQSDVDGLKAGSLDNGYEMNYGGAALGLDYNISENFRLGLALNAGGGDTESQGDFNKTENDFDFWGLSLYASYANGVFGLTGDVGYTSLDNEITQNLPASVGGGRLRADGGADLFTVDLTGEYRIAGGGALEVAPHLGLRYTQTSTDDAKVKLSNGGNILDVATDDQNLFQIPLGVKFSAGIGHRRRLDNHSLGRPGRSVHYGRYRCGFHSPYRRHPVSRRDQQRSDRQGGLPGLPGPSGQIRQRPDPGPGIWPPGFWQPDRPLGERLLRFEF